MDPATETPAEQALSRGFRLGDLAIDPRAGDVVGPGGREKLDPKVMGVLVMLAENAGQVVLREDLLARLWPNAVVTDYSLSRCLYELRRQLSIAGGDERYKVMLETVPKRGYRLNGQIEPLPPPAPPSRAARPNRSKRLFAVAGVFAVLAAGAWFVTTARQGRNAATTEPYSIAVLPFVDLSGEQDQQHFSDGVSEEIITRLNRARSLRVIARASSFSFRDENLGIPEIAAKLGVTHVLEGSVRRSGNRLRITTRLAEASSNLQVWSATFDPELGDLFTVQDEIAEAVATTLSATLSALPAHVPRPEAHNAFLQGEFFYNRRAAGDIGRAVRYYRQAITSDPAYAKPWAALAGAYSLLAYSGELPKDEALTKQAEAARRAIELDPGLAVGHARLAQYYFDIGDRKSSYRTFDRAIALDPNDLLVLTFAAGIAMRGGEVAEAIGRYDRIVALDPRSAASHANRGIYLQAAGRLDEARAELETAKEFNPDFGSEIDLAIARILVVQDRLGEAETAIARLPVGALRDHGLALLRHAQGRQQEADELLRRLAAGPVKPVDIRLAEVFAFRGLKEQAFEALRGIREAIERDEASGASQLWSWQVELRVSPLLKTLHGDPRWDALLFEPL